MPNSFSSGPNQFLIRISPGLNLELITVYGCILPSFAENDSKAMRKPLSLTNINAAV